MIPLLITAEGRRAAAFLAVLGGCIAMTIFAGIGLYQVRGRADFSFYLALAAHAQILVGLTALGALLVKRTFKVGRDGVEVSDQSETVTVTTEIKP